MNMHNLTIHEQQSKQPVTFWDILSEISIVAVIITVGWFLIGYYTHFEFLETGYPDWLYHAFRVRDISMYGIASWDHVWSNGINHWRAFQYIQHCLVFFMTQATGLSITHAMLWLSVSVFIGVRVMMYIFFRYLGINRLFSLFAVIITYTSSQQWVALNDFSIFISFIVVPLYVMLWIRTLENMRYVYVLAAVTGASWSLHPVIGYSTVAMLLFLLFANNLKKDFAVFIATVGVLIISMLPFAIPYLTAGYIIENPQSSTMQFLQRLLLPEYMGLSLIYFILLAISWIIFVISSSDVPRWARILLVYCTLYLVFIYFGLLGYYPSFVYKLQFSRAIPFIALVLPFCFASLLQSSLGNLKSRMIYTIFLVLIVVGVLKSIEIASLHMGQPVASIQNPVAKYFADKDIPKGSIYIKDVPEASYLGKPGLRFVTSYNRFPNPYPIRFNSLMQTDVSYTGVTTRQIKMINDYAIVLGVEYIFIPKLSPLVNGLVGHNTSDSAFEQVGEISTSVDTYSILHNTQPIASAYAFEQSDTASLFHFTDLPKPTLEALSYKPWDEEVSAMATSIRNGQLKPMKLAFEWPNKLVVDGATLSNFRNPSIVVTQSYDANWSVSNVSGVTIKPTNLRFMHLTLPQGVKTAEIDLENNWPWWHWPVQALGVGMITVTLIALWITTIAKRRRSISKQLT